MKEMISKNYDYQQVEKRIYQHWQDKNLFKPKHDEAGNITSQNQIPKQKKFVIAIPPPNVTGRLHMGHALNITIQDMLVRYNRMKGLDTLWIPGTDHAGIATQTVVKKKLDAKGIDYRELGREKFVEQIWDWKEKYGNMILDQIKTVGASCDWSRVRFTMDEKLVKAVNYSFRRLYDDGLIYRGERIVNWCPVDQTALSDDEVETNPEGEPGFLYDIAYSLVNSNPNNNINPNQFIVVSTTRPETLFGDVAVAVHPEDERYQHLIGQKVKLPLTDREIPIIADDYVEKDFGTGCLKITPAHDPNDFEIGQRHEFTPINVLNEDATMNELVPSKYQGLSRYDCRTQVLADLDEVSLLKDKHARNIPLGRSYRSKEVIEYRLSKQWFVKTSHLAEKLLARSEDLNIYPANLRKLWNYWLENIKDWCISRQIWWGHRIPVWYHKDSDKILVDEHIPAQVQAAPEEWVQEEDVLDTWYSSALWPMSILGWPDKTPDFENYFPTTTLSTAKDIIFFWVARMGLMSIYFEDKLPFNNVYFHATVMDQKGKIMSKSKGNGIDPHHVINGATVDELKSIVLDARPTNQETLLKEIEKQFPDGFQGVGADSLRFTLIYLSSNMQSLQISINNFVEIGRRFTTKFWNAARLVFTHLDNLGTGINFSAEMNQSNQSSFIEADWFDISLIKANEKISQSYEEMDFSNLGSYYYGLVWNDFCDWYLEIVKLRMADTETAKSATLQLLAHFKKLLVLLHPIIPFQTEEIFQNLKNLCFEKKLLNFINQDDDLISQPLIETMKSLNLTEANKKLEVDFSNLQEVVATIRSFKKQNGLKDREPLNIFYQSDKSEVKNLYERENNLILQLAKINSFSVVGEQSHEDYTVVVKNQFSLLIDFKPVDEEKQTSEEIEKIKKDIAFIEKRLSNPGFVKNAKPEVVKKESERKTDLETALNRLLNL